MKTKKEKPLPKGFKCRCGVENVYPLYVFAHWENELNFTCDCGRVYLILRGKTEEL